MEHRFRGINFGPMWSVLWVPLMVLAAAVSIPYAGIAGILQRRRERKFAHSMKLKKRVIECVDFTEELKLAGGTLIVERFSLKGPVRYWWTREDVCKLCPYPIVDWLTMLKDVEHKDAVNWIAQRYTSNEGQARLISGSAQKLDSIGSRGTLADHVRYVEIPHSSALG